VEGTGQLVELLPMESLGQLEVRGACGDFMLFASDSDDREPVRLTLDSGSEVRVVMPGEHRLLGYRPPALDQPLAIARCQRYAR
jgi:hypothetical protein